MATPTLSDSPAVQRQYLAQLALTATLTEALASAAATSPSIRQLRTSTVAIVEQLSGVSASIARDYYQTIRREAGVTDLARITPVRPAESAIAATFDEMVAQVQAQADAEAAILQRKLDAEMQKIVTDTARLQVVEAVVGDEMALGFRRVPRPGACAWCIIQAIRSTTRKGLAREFSRYGKPGTMGGEKHYGIYKSRAAAGQNPLGVTDATGEINRFHTGCHCVVEAVFSPVETLPAWLADMERLYDDTPPTDAGPLNDFRRALNALRRGKEPEPPPAPALQVAAPPREQIQALLNLLDQAA